MKGILSGSIGRVAVYVVMVVSMVALAPSTMAATISVGGVGPFSYARDVSPTGGTDVADGDIMDADTIPLRGPGLYGDESYTNSGVQYYVAGSDWFYRPNPYNQVGTAVFHFQADVGHVIQAPTVTSRMFIAGPSGATLYIEGFWSTNNATWTSFARVEVGESILTPVALSGFTPSRDLYLKYELFSSSPSVQSYVRLFLSSANNTTDGFVVSGTVALDPVTIELGGEGPFYFGRDINSNADGDISTNVYSMSGLYYRTAGNNQSISTDDGASGEVVFHFQPDPDLWIETASVESDIRIWFPTASAVGYWSTDNASWTEFVRVEQPGSSDMNYDLIPLTGLVEAPDLYLKYVLNGNKGYPNVFLSDGRFAKKTFVVQGTISGPPLGTLVLIQ